MDVDKYFSDRIQSKISIIEDIILYKSLYIEWFKSNEKHWALFKVKNSGYLKWFLEESMGIYEYKKVEHYVFVTPDDVIEVLSAYPPKVLLEPINDRKGVVLVYPVWD